MKKEPGELLYESWCRAQNLEVYWGVIGPNARLLFSLAEKDFLSNFKKDVVQFDEQSNECPIPNLQEGP